MKKFFQKLMVAILPLISVTSLAADSPEQINLKLTTFYNNPNYKKFIDITNSTASMNNKLIYDFSTMALSKNTAYVKKIVADFSKFSSDEKKLLYISLLASGNKKAAKEIEKNYHYHQAFENFHTTNDINHLEINDHAAHIDILWGSYFATGNPVFIEKILKFINADDHILLMGYEIMNRQAINKLTGTEDYDDIKIALKKQFGENWKKMFTKATTVSVAIWSMNSNLDNDSTLQKNYEEIIKKHPNLDFRKKIRIALGN